MPRFIVVKKIDDGQFRYITEAKDMAEAKDRALHSDDYELVEVFEQRKDHELVRQILWNKLRMWDKSRELEQELGMDLDSLGDTTDAICSGLDKAPEETAYEELEKYLQHIKNFGSIEDDDDA